MAFVALQKYEPMFIGGIKVEPAGTHDRVRQAAGANEPLGAARPVMGLARLLLLVNHDVPLC